MHPAYIARTRPASRLASGTIQHRVATPATAGPSAPLQRPHSSAFHAAAPNYYMGMAPQLLPPPLSLPTLPHVAPQFAPHYSHPPSSPILSRSEQPQKDWYDPIMADHILQTEPGARCFFKMFDTLLQREGMHLQAQQKAAYVAWGLWPSQGKAVFRNYAEMQRRRDLTERGRSASKPADDWPPECAGYTVTDLAAHVRAGLDIGVHDKTTRRAQLWCLRQFNDAVANKARAVAKQGGRPGRKSRFPRYEDEYDWTKPAKDTAHVDGSALKAPEVLKPPTNGVLQFTSNDLAMLTVILPYEHSTRQVLSNVFYEQQETKLTFEDAAEWTYFYYLTDR